MTITRLQGKGWLHTQAQTLGVVEYDLAVTAGPSVPRSAEGTLSGDPHTLRRAQAAHEISLNREHGGTIALVVTEFDAVSQSLGVVAVGPVPDGGDELSA